VLKFIESHVTEHYLLLITFVQPVPPVSKFVQRGYKGDAEGENKKSADFFGLGWLSARSILLDIETTTAGWQLG
jgi:hypothetical protein